MKKILIGLLFVALIATLAAIFVAGKMDGYIAETIRVEGTAAVGTQVDVTEVKTNLKEGTAIINGLTVANPSGYQAPHAISINSFTAEVDYEAEVVEQVRILNPVINAELVGLQSNFQDLLDGMPDSEDEANEETDDTQITIRSLELLKATVNLSSDKLGKTSFVMDDFVMKNLTGTVDEISEQVTNSLISHVSSQVKVFATAQIAKLVKDEAVKKAKEVVNEKIESQVKEKLGDKLGGKLKGLKLKIK